MKKLESYARKRVRALLKGLEKYHQFQETDSLHRIRLEIKKLKSTLLILGFVDKKFKSHQAYLPLRNIFRKAGQIRQPAVMLELLLAHGLEGLPIEKLGDSQKAKDRFRSDTPFFMTEVRKLRKRMSPRWKAVRKRDIAAYVKKLQRLIRRAFVPRVRVGLLHTTRKRLKQAIYLSRLTSQLKKKEARFYASLESAIGDLHDKQTVLKFLKGFPRTAGSFSTSSLRRQAVAERKSIAAVTRKYFSK